MSKDRILVFIPTYNCERQISRVLNRFQESDLPLFTEILVVDNRSTDKTLKVATDALQKMTGLKTKLVQNDTNVNLGGSHKVAFEYSFKNEFDYCLVLHGDDQADINDIVPLIREGKHREYDSFLGGRFSLGSKLEGYSSFRIFGNHVLNALCSLIGGRKVEDMGSGINIYKTNYFKDPFYLHFPDNLTFNVYTLFYGIWKKSKFGFFPIHWREEDQISNAKVFRQTFIILGFLLSYIFKAASIFALPDPSLAGKHTSKVIYES